MVRKWLAWENFSWPRRCSKDTRTLGMFCPSAVGSQWVAWVFGHCWLLKGLFCGTKCKDRFGKVHWQSFFVFWTGHSSGTLCQFVLQQPWARSNWATWCHRNGVWSTFSTSACGLAMMTLPWRCVGMELMVAVFRHTTLDHMQSLNAYVIVMRILGLG